MTDFIHSLGFIIANSRNSASHSTTASYAGAGSDFSGLVAIILFTVSTLIWALNYFTLRTHKLTRQQLSKKRVYEIFAQKKLLKSFTLYPWLRDFFDFAIKCLSMPALYLISSGKNSGLVWSAEVLSIGFILFNIRTVLHEILHPRSTFNRRYLLFETDPRFVRMRSIFEAARRTLYFVIGFAFISYNLNRLYPQMFLTREPEIPLFVSHFESSLTMVCFASDPISFATFPGAIFHILRDICSFSLIILFGNLLISGFSLTDFKNFRRRKNLIDSRIVSTGIESKADLAELIKAIAEVCFAGASKRINPDANLVTELHADRMEMIELQLALEHAFECKVSPDEFASKRTIHEIIDLLWLYVQKQKNEPMFPSILNHFGESRRTSVSSRLNTSSS